MFPFSAQKTQHWPHFSPLLDTIGFTANPLTSPPLPFSSNGAVTLVNYLVTETLLYEAQQQLVGFPSLPGFGTIENPREVFSVLGERITRYWGLREGGVEVITVMARFLLPAKDKLVKSTLKTQRSWAVRVFNFMLQRYPFMIQYRLITTLNNEYGEGLNELSNIFCQLFREQNASDSWSFFS